MKTKLLTILLLSILLIFSVSWKSYTTFQGKAIPQNIWDLGTPWAKKMLDSMTLDQKIGQLFMVPVYPNSKQNIEQVDTLIKKYHIGGIIYFRGHPTQIAKLSNHFQKISQIPLFIGIDAEWGLAMRMDSVLRYPYQMTLGAITDNRLIYQMGLQIGQQLRMLGININFAPVVDINNNPANPVIGIRSFGENARNVAAKGFAYAQGLQDAGVIAVAKHFPGHGDTKTDSHKDLPVIPYDYQRLYKVELFPFRQLIHTGVMAIMVGHLDIPKLDDALHTPATLSNKIVNGVLRDSLGFKGLVFTDALDMKGVSKYFAPGEAELRALLAGDDVLLMSEDVPKAFRRIKQAVKYGEIPDSILDKAVLRILTAKSWLAVEQNFKQISTQDLTKRLNADSNKVLIDKLYRSAITIVKNDDSLLPIKNLSNLKIAAVNIGNGKPTEFAKYLSYYAKIDNFYINKNARYNDFVKLRQKLLNYDLIIVGILNTNNFNTKTYGISENTVWFLARLAEQKNVILDIFASPYALNKFPNLEKVKAIVVSYQDTKPAQRASAQIIFGGFPAQGHLPVSTKFCSSGIGITTSRIRLNYVRPAELNLNKIYLQKIDSVIASAIDSGAFPGCQILAIKDTSVFFYKAYGYYTYAKRQKVTQQTIYDLASITKIAATTLALMKLYEEGKFDIKARLSKYLPELDTTNKAKIKIIDVLTHQARLYPWIPFYLHTYLPNTKTLNPKIYSAKPKPGYTTQVAKNLYILNSYRDTIFDEIYSSKLLRRKHYRYSDLGFYMFKQVIERQTGEPFDKYVTEQFYKPLGAYTTRFNPLKYFPKSQIAPTEDDNFFRHQLVQGYVQDYGAAMLGGISGHAGLFSDANDLAKIFQMLLQQGYYGGKRYLEAKTIKLFTTKPFKKSHRALGFDSKSKGEKFSFAAPQASLQSYGHTGFTGTMVWVDPKYNFVYIFLSNRVYPSAKNFKINHLKVRTKVHELFYEAMGIDTNGKN